MSAMSRRAFMGWTAATSAGFYAGMSGSRFGSSGALAAPRGTAGRPAQPPAPPAAPPAPVIRRPGSRPRPDLAAGTDVFPGIEHVIVLMMENHSFDSYFGLLGKGDGLRRGADGRPVNSNPDASGHPVSAYPMTSTCQTIHLSMQSWNASHQEWNNGRNDGFVRTSGPVAMGCWTPAALPFYAGLARTFPLADRWFASCLGPTHPNRRFLIAGTAAGLVHNRRAISTDTPPAGGTIFNLLDAHGLTWRNYYVTVPTAGLYMTAVSARKANLVPIGQFFADAKSGSLPNFSIVDPDYLHSSEESPTDVSLGEAYAASVINAVMQSPAWPKTVLIWCYDEHGGYYDHVPPPAAIRPDAIPPQVGPHDFAGGFDRFGFRVPAVVVSPFARTGYVSRVVHDHTSILKFVETKWNLPAMTYRDANASDLLDCLDFRKASFLNPPRLPAPSNTTDASRCAVPHRPRLRLPSGQSTVDDTIPDTTVAAPTSRVARVASGRLDADLPELVAAATVIGATAATAAVGRSRLLRWATSGRRTVDDPEAPGAAAPGSDDPAGGTDAPGGSDPAGGTEAAGGTDPAGGTDD